MNKSLKFSLQVIGHLSYMIVLPLLAFGSFGAFIDGQTNSRPLYLLLGIGIAFIITIFWITKQLPKVIRPSKISKA